MKVDFEPIELLEKECNQNGRIYIGSEYAGEKLKVMIIED